MSFDIFKNLPPTILGEKVILSQDDASLWPSIKKLTQDQQKLVLEERDCLRKDLLDTYANVYADKKYYKKTWAADIRKRNTDPLRPETIYWILNAKDKKIVGWNIVYGIYDYKTIELGYAVFPEHRKQGFAAASCELLSRYILDNKLATAVCGECGLENIASEKTLLKSGFKECGIGLTRIPGHNNAPFRRFIISRDKNHPWPYSDVTP